MDYIVSLAYCATISAPTVELRRGAGELAGLSSSTPRLTSFPFQGPPAIAELQREK